MIKKITAMVFALLNLGLLFRFEDALANFVIYSPIPFGLLI
jgi:hypothetical protein